MLICISACQYGLFMCAYEPLHVCVEEGNVPTLLHSVSSSAVVVTGRHDSMRKEHLMLREKQLQNIKVRVCVCAGAGVILNIRKV